MMGCSFEAFLDGIWNIKEGFAVLIAGFCALLAATVAYRAVSNQIHAQEKIERERAIAERKSVEIGLLAELLGYSRSIIQATSRWNLRSVQEAAIPGGYGHPWPRFVPPVVYHAVVSKIGLLVEGWPAAAIIGFFANLTQLNEMASEASGPPSTDEMAASLRLMASNLSDALDGLNQDREIPLPKEIDLADMFDATGQIIADDSNPPKNIQALLKRLAE